MAKKSNDKKSAKVKGEADSVVKDLEKRAAKALSKAEAVLAAAKKTADDVSKSAKRAATDAAKSAKRAADDAAKSAKKARKHAKAVKSGASSESRPGWDGVPSEDAGSAASARSGRAKSKTPTVSKDGASVTGAPPLPAPDEADTPGIGWTVARLRGVARERGVSGYWSMSKDRLVEELTARK